VSSGLLLVHFGFMIWSVYHTYRTACRGGWAKRSYTLKTELEILPL